MHISPTKNQAFIFRKQDSLRLFRLPSQVEAKDQTSRPSGACPDGCSALFFGAAFALFAKQGIGQRLPLALPQFGNATHSWAVPPLPNNQTNQKFSNHHGNDQ